MVDSREDECRAPSATRSVNQPSTFNYQPTRMAEEILVILTTWPDGDKARVAARALVEEHLAACANIVPAVESIYRWEGNIETASEVLMLVKSTIGRYVELETRIKAL